MTNIHHFFQTMTGRLFIVLLSGMFIAALSATLIAEANQRKEADRHNLLRTADRVYGYIELLNASSPELREKLLDLGGSGILRVTKNISPIGEDIEFTGLLASLDSRLTNLRVDIAKFQDCRPPLPDFLPPPNVDRDPNTNNSICRLIHLELNDGKPITLALMTRNKTRSTALISDPIYLSLLALCIGFLAYGVARLANKPLKQLADAADELGRNLERQPLALEGPLEVKRAAHAFNAMQQRIQRHLAERTHMLAAITHDLQTPLTRLRLRIENVNDPALQERLIADVASMHELIREGLDLARSATTSEQPVALDLDSLLESVVEDAAESGGDVQFEKGCGKVLMLRPLSVKRLFSNLVDNAIKYGFKAHVSSEYIDNRIVVSIRDEGEGLTKEDLEKMLEPFVRLETSRSRSAGGVGLGLTIARTLAEKDGATLTLHNHEQGGLEARVIWNQPKIVSTEKL